MKKQGISRINTTLIVLVVTFLIVIFGGRFLFNNTLPIDDRVEVNSQQESQKNTTQSDAVQSDVTQQKSLSCTDTIRADIEQKKQSFVKGQILVTFSKEVTYAKARDVLSVYGLVIQNEMESQRSFASRQLITAAVAPGQEIVKICQLRSDAQIKYAGLDLYFNIHE